MDPLRLIDLHFGGREHAIGVYLVETEDGPALFDTGPTSTLPALEEGSPGTGSPGGTFGTCSSPTSTSTTLARRARSFVLIRI
jgi:hypothetical protein